MDVRVAQVAEAHDGLVPWRALGPAGLERLAAARAVAGLRRVHDGVWLTGYGRITVHQRRLAATLSTPDAVLSHASAGDLHVFRPWEAAFHVVTRPGSGGPRRIDGLLVCRSSLLASHVVLRDGVRVTSAARTIVDLSAHLSEKQRAKAVRQAIRLKATTALEVRLVAAAHHGRRGIAGLEALAARLEKLPLARTRSDAEARALEVLQAAGRASPQVNRWLAGEEADLVWVDARRILEIDGPQFHQDPVEDARKEAAWRAAGWTVHRIPSDLVFDDPVQLVTLATELERPSGPA
jgi:very-short-patch-repair endonuclease